MAITINGTTGIAGVDGSASTPAVQGSDTNTGIAFPVADTVAVATGGSERMRIDSSGNLGIGTSSPSAKLDIVGSNNAINLELKNSSGANYIQVDNGTANGYFGVSGSNTIAMLSIGTHPLVFGVDGGTERMRIDSSGNLLVGKTSTSGTATGVIAYGSGAADHGMISVARGSNATMIEFRTTATGNIVGQISQNGTNTTYSTSSDYRLKHDIQPMIGALAKVSALKPVTYKWNADDSDGEGFIANELAEVCPHAVTGAKDAVDVDGNPIYQGIDTSFLVATLTAAIQELKADLDATKAELATLKGAA